ncbi:hypothetical protein LUX57_00575 [Actinomadura madurae]|uniref:hypothetical protein n=1 Tax=Actinomadura madurae TaxID=1993 RepID=UPI0020D22D07|nr:hypothetical protein [Actinomadura madurae]MCP9963863.1 hypothetical protein [Actinomadura madurae]
MSFAMSDRFGGVLEELILDAFPDGVVNDESLFAAVIEDFLFRHRLPNGSRVVERFVAENRDLDEQDKALLLGWLDNVQGMFEIMEPYGDDGVIAYNHVDELNYRVRSNMGPEGVEALTPGTIVIGGIVPVGDEWMISGTPMAFAADQADDVLAGLPEIVMRYPARVFRNPEKLARARELQDEQRRAFIDLYGGDLIVVPGDQVNKTLMDFYRHNYELAAASPARGPNRTCRRCPRNGRTRAASPSSTTPKTASASMSTTPSPSRRSPHPTSSDGGSTGRSSPPTCARRASAPSRSAVWWPKPGPTPPGRVFQKLLKKPRFSWERDGEALLRKYKADWYANPPLPRVTPTSPALTRRFRDANRQ